MGELMNDVLDPNHAVYVGSFDPLTLGHMDIIQRGAHIFGRLTVGIGINPDKVPLLTSEERLAMATEAVQRFPNVDVRCFEGLAVDFVKSLKAAVMLRGVRTLTDIDAEFTMTLANRSLEPAIETVFLMASERYSHISSSLIKQIVSMAGERTSEQLAEFLPVKIIAPLLAKFRQR